MAHASKDFFELVKSIGESKSKQEEDRIIANEVKILKAVLANPLPTGAAGAKRIREILVRLIYVEMLGHDASWGFVVAIQQTASQDLPQKRAGYLACSLMLSPSHEFRFMLVNQMQRDLGSANVLEVNAALVALCKLVTLDMIPALLTKVTTLLQHDQTLVRKKAVMALHRFHQLDPTSIVQMSSQITALLRDRDPAVMGAALCLLHDLAKNDTSGAQTELVDHYVSILKQITEHRLPRDFDYHRIPAPWIQIKLLQILATLGQNDKKTSEAMYEVLGDCMRRADTGSTVGSAWHNIGSAIVYEVVKTVTTIWPETTLLDHAANAITRFITSDVYNLKYLGVTALAAIVRDHPRYAAQHQMAVIECLEDPDETLKRKTLELLFRMTNPVNAEVVVGKLLGFLKDASDPFLKADLVTRITQLSERYAPNNIWFIETLCDVFKMAGDLVDTEVAHNLLRLLAEGEEEDEEGNMEMRAQACRLFVDALDEVVNPPQILLKVSFWTLGEFAYLIADEVPLERILELVCETTDRVDYEMAHAKAYGVFAAAKMSAQLGHLHPSVLKLFDTCAESRNSDLMQRAAEFKELFSTDVNTCKIVFPVDASCEDFEGADFSFLEEFVQVLRAAGANEYDKTVRITVEHETMDGGDGTSGTGMGNGGSAGTTGGTAGGLRFEAYAAPSLQSLSGPPPPLPPQQQQQSITSSAPELTSQTRIGSSSGISEERTPVEMTASLRVPPPSKSVWGPQGYMGNLAGNLGGGIPTPASMQTSSQPPLNPSSTLDLEVLTGGTSKTAPVVSQPVVTTPSATTQSQPKEIKPRVLTEKEKMAAALFGGIVSSDNATSGGGGKTRMGGGKLSGRGKGVTTSTVNTPREDMDLLGTMEDTVVPQQQQQQPVPTTPSMNLLDVDLFSNTATQPQQQQPPPTLSTTPAINQNKPVDLFAMPSSVKPAPSVTTPQPTTTNGNSLIDLFSSATMLNVTSPPTTTTTASTIASAKQMTTAQFGAHWPAHSAELRFPVNSTSGGGFQAFVKRLETKLGVSLVEFIPATMEAILVGVIGKPMGQMEELVLLHTKERNATMVDVMVRCKNVGQSQRFFDILKGGV